MAKKLVNASVQSVTSVAQNTIILSLKHSEIARYARAGQFVQVKVPHCPEVFWRRPFSIHDTHPDNGTFDLLFNIVGRGTLGLSELKPGESVNVIGPLGNSFSYSEKLSKAVLVAGGLGIAPFKLLLRQLPPDINVTLFYGTPSKAFLLGLDDLNARTELVISTDDGSYGATGLITEQLDKYLQEQSNVSGQELFVCGPTPMLLKVQQLAKEYNVPAQVSVETIMACGFGACMGCAVPLAHPNPGEKEYALACTDGPVFNIKEIIFHG